MHQVLVWEGPDLLLDCPADVTIECPAEASPGETGMAVASGGCATPTVTYADQVTPGCGGTRTIRRTFKATDGGQRVSCVQTIHVVDTTPPAVEVDPLAPCYASAADAEAAGLSLARASDACSERVLLAAATSGLCAATVTVSATDACGNSSSAGQPTRIDATPPEILDLGPLHRTCLWPPDHRLVCFEDLVSDVSAADNCPGDLALAVAAATSDQPGDARGDGRTEPDTVLLGVPLATGVCLRAERQGGAAAGRTYEVAVSATDSCGNVSLDSIVIRVPHDRQSAGACAGEGGGLR